MTETPNPNNPLNNEQDLEKLILDLKTEIHSKSQEIETWKNGKIKTEQALFEIERKNARLQEDIEALKRENLRQRRIELESQETKQKNDTLALFEQKLQAKMGGNK